MNRASYLLWGFLACQFVALTRIAWLGWFGTEYAPVATTANVVSLVFAASLPVAYLRGEGLLLSRVGRNLVGLLGLCGGGMLVTGIARGWMLHAVVYDLGSWIVLLAFMVAGSTNSFWKDFLRVVPVVLAAGVVVCLSSLGDLAQKVELALAGERIARDLAAYRLIWVLYLFPVLMVLVQPEHKSGYFSAAAAVTLAFGLQFLFQKRLETVFVCLVLALVGLRLVLSVRTGKLAEGEGPIRVLGTTMFIMIVAALLTSVLMPGVMGAQAKVLFGRFANLFPRHALVVTTAAPATEPIVTTPIALPTAKSHVTESEMKYVPSPDEGRWYERWLIVSQSLADFTYLDWVCGRGFGGAVSFRHKTLEYYMTLPSKSSLLAPYTIAETGKIGRRQLEVGWAMPLIKGGVLAQTLVMAALLYALLRKGNDDWVSRGCKLLLGLYLLRYLFGGAFILGDSLQFAAFSAIFGRCLRSVDLQNQRQILPDPLSFPCNP